jgi:RecA-family ATPase
VTDLNSEILNACADIGVDLNPDTTTPATAAPPLMAGLMTAEDAWHVDVPDREWIVEGLLPVGVLTLLTAPGGEGKTLLAQQLATCVAAGTAALGLPTTQTPVLALYAEDDRHELTRRQKSILRVTGIDPADASCSHYKSLVGDNAILGHSNRDGSYSPSDLFEQIRATALALKSRFIILDNVTQMYSGDFNDRTQVTAFLRPLANLAAEINGSVLLLGHVSKAEDSTYAGSAAWHSGVRSLLTIKRGLHTAENRRIPVGATMERDYRTVTQHKANYSAGGTAHVFRWHEGAFVASRADDEVVDDASREDIFLRHLASLTNRKMAVSASRNASNYAPKLMSAEFRASRTHMEDAMERLIDEGRIDPDVELPWHRSRGKIARGIAVRQSAPAPVKTDPMADLFAKISRRADA